MIVIVYLIGAVIAYSIGYGRGYIVGWNQARVAQSAERDTRNFEAGGSIPPLGSKL